MGIVLTPGETTSSCGQNHGVQTWSLAYPALMITIITTAVPIMKTPAIFTLIGWFACAQLGAGELTPYQQLGRDIYKELIETDTTHSTGDTTKAAELLARRFRDAGFPEADIQVVGPESRNKNLVVRYRGAGVQAPVLLLAHLDVVEAKREDWSFDPFKLTERDG